MNFALPILPQVINEKSSLVTQALHSASTLSQCCSRRLIFIAQTRSSLHRENPLAESLVAVEIDHYVPAVLH
jgi:hypothetical protein